MVEDERVEVTDEFLEARRQESFKAFNEERFLDALSLMQRGVMATALKWFSDEGVSFSRPDEEIPTTSLVLGLAAAAALEVQERGEGASFRLQTASTALNTVAALRAAYERPFPDTPEGFSERLAELILLASDVGRMDGFMVQIRTGVLDRLSEMEAERERKRLGAHIVNRKKASIKEDAFAAALQITAVNKALSHEDLAVKIRDRKGLSVRISTISGWIREWRKAGELPARQ
jgi:hypothetical protein